MKKLSETFILIRPHYWSKNLLIFIPYFANKNESVEIFSKLFVGLLILCLVSSIGYVFNDIIDLENDKRHDLFSFNKEILKYSNSCILIGPEGDFTLDEINLCKDNGFKSITLGDSRLRTETAGIIACNLLNVIQNL